MLALFKMKYILERERTMKHVVLFSGGASSAYVAYLVSQTEKKKDIVFLHTPTYSENHDADTFRNRVARYLGFPITDWGDGRDLWELIEENHCLPGQFIPFCTTQLKQKMKEEYYKYLDSIGEQYIEYIGYGMEEWRRVQKAWARNQHAGREVKFPVFEKKIPGEEIKRIIKDEWKIPLPKAYENLNHNNCIPCFKAGKQYWKVYWEKYPEKFQKAVEYEQRIGYTVFKDRSLLELADVWKHNKDIDDAQVKFGELIPCECWV